MVLLGFTGFYWVLLGFTGFYRVLLGLTRFYWVSMGFTGIYWVLLVFLYSFHLIDGGFGGGGVGLAEESRAAHHRGRPVQRQRRFCDHKRNVTFRKKTKTKYQTRANHTNNNKKTPNVFRRQTPRHHKKNGRNAGRTNRWR